MAPEVSKNPLLVYIRHPWLQDAHPVFVSCAAEDVAAAAEQVLARNWVDGFHPLPSVLDALTSSGHVLPQLVMEFDTTSGEHYFQAESQSGVIRGACRMPDIPGDVSGPLAAEVWNSFVRRNHLDSLLLPCAHNFFSDHSSVDHLSVRSLLGGIAATARYVRAFSCRHSATSVAREEGDPLGFCLGVSVFSGRELSQESARTISSAVNGALEQLCRVGKDIRANGEQLKEALEPAEFLALEKCVRSTFAPDFGPPKDQVLRAVSSQIASMFSGRYASSRLARTDAFKNNIAHFLLVAQDACDRTVEGASLEYGLILGGPFYLRHWPGALPIPVEFRGFLGRDVSGASLDSVFDLTYLSAGPAYRALAVPYQANYKANRDSGEYPLRAPLFSVDLRDLHTAFLRWPKSAIFSSTGGLHAYMTQHYPWSVSAIVGPGSSIRVFALGELVAHRNGKGWSVRRGPQNSFPALQAACQVALQLSPFARPKKHGGFIVYHPTEDGYHEAVREGWYEGLHLGEPDRISVTAPPIAGSVGGIKWLTGQKLLMHDEVDYNVAERVLRAAEIDGAVVLAGPDATVMAFGQRLKPPEVGGALGGSKRATASAFVRATAESEGRIPFALAVSADGPIRLYRGGEEEVENLFAPLDEWSELRQ